MRTFRVVCTLNRGEFNGCFSVHGALRRSHKGEKYRSLRAAISAAKESADTGWYAYVVRRIPAGGWELMGTATPE